ncbi:MAG TPA: DUF222 domain-containing protein, partial [Acidimicrobiales bacterium]
MFEGLASEIRELDIPVDGAALVQVLALRDRLDAVIAEAVGEFDSVGLWDVDGSTSMVAWLKSNASMTSKSAGWLVAMARRLRKLPVCSAALLEGRLAGGQVETILAHLNDSTVEAFAVVEAELVPYLAPLTVRGCARAMASWKE